MRSWWSCTVMWLLGAQSASVGQGNESLRLDGPVKVPIYGGLSVYAYFFLDVLLGAEGGRRQRASMIVDTGSRSAAVVCAAACEGCEEEEEEEQHHLDPPFRVDRSPSGQWLNCSSSSCEANCTAEDRCPFEAKYSEGSYLSGFWLTDYVSFGDAPQVPPRRTQLGCSTRSSRQFTRQRASGIIGLAPPPILDAQAMELQPSASARAPAILRDLFGAAAFSLCFARWGGSLTIGADEDGWANGTVQWLTMDTSYLYRIYPKALWLGSTIVGAGDLSFGNTIVDSGTSFTLLPIVVFRTLMVSLSVHCAMHQGCGATALGDDCWQVNNGTAGPTGFPSLQMEFGGGGLVDWSPHSYLFVRDPLFEPDVWCLAIQAHPHRETLLGVSWMLHRRVIFDIVGSRLGVAEAQCSEHEDRPVFTSVTTSTTGTVAANSKDENATMDEDQHQASSNSSDTRNSTTSAGAFASDTSHGTARAGNFVGDISNDTDVAGTFASAASNDTTSAGPFAVVGWETSVNISIDQNQSNPTVIEANASRVNDKNPASDTVANSTTGLLSNATDPISSTSYHDDSDSTNTTTATAADMVNTSNATQAAPNRTVSMGADAVNVSTTPQVASNSELDSAPDLSGEGLHTNGSSLLRNNSESINGSVLLDNDSDETNKNSAAGTGPRRSAPVDSPTAEPSSNATDVTESGTGALAVEAIDSLEVSSTSMPELDAGEPHPNLTANVSNASSSSPTASDGANDTEPRAVGLTDASESGMAVVDAGVIGAEGARVPINSNADFEAAFSRGTIWRARQSGGLRCQLLLTGLVLPSTLVVAVLALRGLMSARWRMRRAAPGGAWVRIQSAGIMAIRAFGEQVRLLDEG